MAAEKSAFGNYRPLVSAALGFGLGVTLSILISGIWRFVAICPIAVLGGYLRSRERRHAAVPICFIALGLLRGIAAEVLPSDSAFEWAVRLAEPIKDALAGNISVMFGDDAPLVTAILLGDRAMLDQGVYSIFRDAGVAHVLALSGLHVTMLSGALMLVLPKRFPRIRFICVAVFLLVYCAVAAFPASLVRASVMTLYYLAAMCFNRRRDALCSLAAAFLTILIIAPTEITSVGFQLSFAAVLGIALLYKPVFGALAVLPDAVGASVAVSVCGTLGTLPLSLYHFGRLNTYAVLANVFLLPLVPFGVIPAFVAMLLYGAMPETAQFIANAARLFFDAFVYLGGAFASVPYAVLTYTDKSVLSLVFFYTAMLVLSPYVLRERGVKVRAATGLLTASIAAFAFESMI